MAVQRPFIQNDPNIAPFLVEGHLVGRQLGIGSYGSVEEVEVNGLICAGKKIHEALLDIGNVGVEEVTRKYMEECQLFSNLRHPNITQFLGVCFLPECTLPVLLMERLDSSLDDVLETLPNIPLTLKLSILEDVARGLLYLHNHNPQVVHRDLTVKNVLLTASLDGKITDFGNSRIVNLQPGQLACTLSRLPGTLVYMPPEALSAAARYGPSLDVFSFGHLALFILTQVFPGELLEPTYPDPNSPDVLVARSEVGRRERFFEQLERDQHCCLQLTKACLHNIPSRRPTAEQIVSRLVELRADIDGPFGAIVKADAVRQVVMMKTLKRMREQTNELAEKEEEIQLLRVQIENLGRRHELEIQQRDAEHQQRVNDMEQQIQQLQILELNLREEIRQKDAENLFSRISLQGEQNQIQAPLPLSEPTLPLSVNWRHGKSMPFAMNYYPEAVLINEKVFVGGGTSGGVAGYNETVMVYNITNDEWSLLPEYEFYWFSLACIKNHLVLVGGVHRNGQERTNQLGVWDEEGGTWLHNIPSMPTARSGASVVTYKDRWLIVAGGFDMNTGMLSIVEVLDILTGYWHLASQLPIRQYKMSSTLIGNMWYLLGGYPFPSPRTQCMCVCMDDLIQKAVFQLNSPSTWRMLPNTPFTRSTALSVNGALLAVGGSNCPSLHLYKPSSNSWVNAGELNFVTYSCACTFLPNGIILVMGGDKLLHSCSNEVKIGTLDTSRQ